MKYTVEDKNGTQHASLSEEEVLALVQQDLLLNDSKMKKAMMPAWEKVENFDFLKEALAEQAERLAAEIQNNKKAKKGNKKAAVSAPDPNSRQSFENALTPVKAGIFSRFFAFAFDICAVFLIFMFFSLLATIGAQINGKTTTVTASDSTEVADIIKYRAAEKEKYKERMEAWKELCSNLKAEAEAKKEDVNNIRLPDEPQKPQLEQPPITETVESSLQPSVIDDSLAGFRIGSDWDSDGTRFVCISASPNKAIWCNADDVSFYFNIAICLTVIASFFYFALPLGLCSQTGGMWYFGIFITDQKIITKDVLPIRAYSFFLLSVLTCYLVPFFVIIGLRSPAEMLLKVRMIKVAAAA